MSVFPVPPASPPDSAAVEAAAAALVAEEVIGVPTDTVYGLAALAASSQGCAALFRLKGRPPAVALPVLVGDLEAALGLAAPSARPALEAVGRALWPGPLTVVVVAHHPAPHLGGDPTTVGIRWPDDPVMAAICRQVGPLAVTSANRHGEAPCTSAHEVAGAFPTGLAAILDGGQRAGSPSSVVALRDDGQVVVLRPGPVGAAEVRRALAPIRGGEGPR